MSYNQNWQQQDPWQQSSPASDYAMDGMVYDHRTLPSSTAIQRSTMAAQYSVPTSSYAGSPVTPISASSYGGQAQYGDYQPQPYQYAAPTPSSYVDQIPLRHAQRPLAPPTPPLEDERYHGNRAARTVKSSARRSARRSVSVVKSEASFELSKNMKTCSKQVRTDGKTLVNQFDKPMDRFLALAKEVEPVLPSIKNEIAAGTPESMASPMTDEDSGHPRVKKDKECEYCGRLFAQKAQLTTHLRSHTGEKPFRCNICGICVSQPGNLKSHQRRHTNEQKYECTVCNVKFKANGSLKAHIRTAHENEPRKPCPMEDCAKEFTTIGNMKVHINKFHEKKLFEYMDLISRHDKSQPFPEDVAELWVTLLRIYKNSNCGIKGRGTENQQMKDIDAYCKEQEKFRNEQLQRQAIATSPVASSAVSEHRTFYDENIQQHYAVRSAPAQQHSSYGQQQQPLPMHHSPAVYHGLPEPTTYNMGWSPHPQYPYPTPASHV